MGNYNVYRAKNDGTGGNLQFSLNVGNKMFFISGAPQVGGTKVTDAKFDYEKKINMKLNEAELGLLIAVLTGRQEKASLFHSTKGGTSQLSLSMYEAPDKNDKDKKVIMWGFRLSKNNDKDSTVKAGAISVGDAEMIVALLRAAIPVLIDWTIDVDYKKKDENQSKPENHSKPDNIDSTNNDDFGEKDDNSAGEPKEDTPF